MTQYFLFATTQQKPVMRFFNHKFEIFDFLNLMGWKNGKSDEVIVEIYQKMNEDEIKEKM